MGLIRLLILSALSCIFLHLPVQGQPSGDSLAIHKVNAAFNLISQNPDSALSIAEKSLQQAQRTSDPELEAYAHKTRGWAWLHKGSYDKAFPDLLQSLQLFTQLHDVKEEMYMGVNLGIAYSNRSQFVSAAKYLLIADSLTRIQNDTLVKAEVSRQMGILYREQHEYPKATGYFRESIAMFTSHRDTMMAMDAITSLCLVYQAMSLPDSCLALLNAAAPLLPALRAHNYEKAMLQERYGDAWFAKAQYESAMASYTNAYKVFVADNNKADAAYEAMNLGRAEVQLKKYSRAEAFLLISYRLADSLKIDNYSVDAAGQLADLYGLTGDWHKAYQWLEKSNSLRDSLQLSAEKEKTAELQAQYETDKRDREIALLKKDQDLNHAIVQKQKVFQVGAVIAVILLLLIAVLVITRYRAINAATRLVELEKMRNSIARDLHDDMGSALSSIHIISKVAMENAGERQQVNEQLKKIHESSGAVLENMSDIVWSINPVNDTLEKVLFKMSDFAADIFEPLNIRYTFNQSVNFQHVKLGLQTRKDLFLVFKEAVNNAAKYSRCTEVKITVEERDRYIEMQVKDNGIGFDRNGVKSGNGLRNMEERARRFNGTLAIAGGPGEGTNIILKLRSHD